MLSMVVAPSYDFESNMKSTKRLLSQPVASMNWTVSYLVPQEEDGWLHED